MYVKIEKGAIKIIPTTDFEEDWIDNCMYETYEAEKCYETTIGHCGYYIKLNPIPPKDKTK